ncbi:MAG TPA: hypothetical protein VMR50_04975 [Myxococcota bacterium]|nr:hypothetical protein [Myxococcota bacterium]
MRYTLAIAFALALATGAAAHTQTGALGAAASATDFYQVTCSDDGSGPPQSLILQIQDTTSGSAPLVGVQGQRGSQTTNSVDPTSGDTNPSPQTYVNGTSGVFDVVVYKTGAGADSYTLTYHCYTGLNGTGVHTGTTIVVRQNQ